MPRTAVSEIHTKVVGRELKETRQALGLTQAEVAERLGVSPSYLSAVEAGRRNLTLGQLANIANAMRLGIDISFVRADGTPVRVDRRDARDDTLARQPADALRTQAPVSQGSSQDGP